MRLRPVGETDYERLAKIGAAIDPEGRRRDADWFRQRDVSTADRRLQSSA